MSAIREMLQRLFKRQPEESEGEDWKRNSDTAEFERKAREFYAIPLPEIDPGGLLLQSGERCYWNSHSITVSLQTHTRYEGGSSGISMRVARGVYLRSNAYKGQPIREEAMERNDEGKFWITDRRFVFVGRRNSRDIPFSAVLSVDSFSVNGLCINVRNGKPLRALVGVGPWAKLTYLRITRGLVGGLEPDVIDMIFSEEKL